MKDEVETEKVHRQATAMIKGTKELLYQGWLKRLGVFSLKKEKSDGGTIKIYKIMKTDDKVPIELSFTKFGIIKCRRHSLKLAENHLKFIKESTFLLRL